ncbi:hypothetical protein D4A39_02350 [Alcanivorax profundi]|uniref:DUF6916 domain-containing protein n=2 Tax=Alcanivorax TaxID=59753 RepID=A0A418Y2E7_9GAMM|nr:hypothetical protein [Alcanivorax profundi]RJG19714.1 hypothetical protein D4A39_02350 [Alcanivorax profundi]
MMVTLEQWKNCEGQVFTLEDGSTLTLAEVSVPSMAEGWECFSLLFAGNQQREQGTVAMRHDAAGELTVFLVPLGPLGSNDGTCYFEAVFNRQVANS